MLVRLSKNTFVRIYDDGEIGYIFNQLNRHDRIYTGAGVDLLTALSRSSQNQETLIQNLVNQYEGVDPLEIYADLTDMILSLEQGDFVVRGESEAELLSRDKSFSYSSEVPKTFIEDFTQLTNETVQNDTETYHLIHDRKRPRLSSIQFELTSKCNERCIHCYIPNGKKDAGYDMPLSKVKNIIDQFSDMGGLHVTLSGGEALLHKDIAEILRYCRKKDLQISLLTNLALLKQDLIPVIQEVNVSIVQTSLYSMDPLVHDTITKVNGSWYKTMNAIVRLYEANVPVQISCPVMKANCKGYDRVMKFAQSLKMKAQTDYIMMAQSDLDTSNLSNRISLDDTEILIREIAKTDTSYKELKEVLQPISSLSEEELTTMPLCGVGLNQICVTASGDLFPCAGWQAMTLGNVYKDTLKHIWETSTELTKLRSVTRAAFPKCLKCEAKDYCSMCMARNYNESDGNMFEPPIHTCKVAFLNKRIAEELIASQSHD